MKIHKDLAIVEVDGCTYSLEFLRVLPWLNGIFCISGPISVGRGLQTCELQRLDDRITRAADALETALSASSPADKDLCIRAARSCLQTPLDTLEVSRLMAASEGDS